MSSMPTVDDDDDILALTFFRFDDEKNSYDDENSSLSHHEGPGRGNAVLETKKRTPGVTRQIVINKSAFDDLHQLCFNELSRPIMSDRNIVKNTTTAGCQGVDAWIPMRFFFLLDVFDEPNEGGLGVERVFHRYGISVSTVSEYFRHSLFALFKSLRQVEPLLISWPSEVERAEMAGLIIVFPLCAFFVGGNKSKRWRPKDAHEQERAYDGYKKAHPFSLVVFCDLFGGFIRVEVTDKGAESSRNLYTDSDVFQNPDYYLSDGQHGMADMGFAGEGAMFCGSTGSGCAHELVQGYLSPRCRPGG